MVEIGLNEYRRRTDYLLNDVYSQRYIGVMICGKNDVANREKTAIPNLTGTSRHCLNRMINDLGKTV